VLEAPLNVLLQPVNEPLPPFEQGFVHELDRSVVDDKQSPLDEGRQHSEHALVVVGIELAARHAAPRERLTVAAGDEPEQHATSDLLLVLAE
jgi:hypothetical protein